MTKRKPIKVRIGCIKKLAEDCGVSPLTVRMALRWQADTDNQNLVRQRAKELGYIRRF